MCELFTFMGSCYIAQLKNKYYFSKIALVECYSFTEMKDLRTELSDGSLEVLRAAQRSNHR